MVDKHSGCDSASSFKIMLKILKFDFFCKADLLGGFFIYNNENDESNNNNNNYNN